MHEETEAHHLGSLVPETVLLSTTLDCPKVKCKNEYIRTWRNYSYFPGVIFLEVIGWMESIFMGLGLEWGCSCKLCFKKFQFRGSPGLVSVLSLLNWKGNQRDFQKHEGGSRRLAVFSLEDQM